MSDICTFVSKWEEIDDEIADTQKRLKDIKKMKDDITETIKMHMISEKIENVVLPSSKHNLRLKSRVKLSPINQEYIKETLNGFFSKPFSNDPEVLANETTESIMNNRDSEEVFTIRRTKK